MLSHQQPFLVVLSALGAGSAYASRWGDGGYNDVSVTILFRQDFIQGDKIDTSLSPEPPAGGLGLQARTLVLSTLLVWEGEIS